MAGPVTHIVLALHILHLLPTHIDIPTFIVGTSFPDIRYLAGLSREATHIEQVSWDDVCNEPCSFRAGMLFHNLVDIIRLEQFEGDFYDRMSPDLYSATYRYLFPIILKTAEDAWLYRKVNNWQTISSYFDCIYQEELDFEVDSIIIRDWHERIQKYILQEPDADSIAQFVLPNIINNYRFNLDSALALLLYLPIFNNKISSFYATFIDYITLHHSERISTRPAPQPTPLLLGV